MVVTARQLCFSLHGTRGAPCTDAPVTQAIHWSATCWPASIPDAVVGSATYDVLSAPPPTTSQRYPRAPSSQAFFEGRNHTQLTIARITVLSSAPRNCSNRVEQPW